MGYPGVSLFQVISRNICRRALKTKPKINKQKQNIERLLWESMTKIDITRINIEKYIHIQVHSAGRLGIFGTMRYSLRLELQLDRRE